MIEATKISPKTISALEKKSQFTKRVEIKGFMGLLGGGVPQNGNMGQAISEIHRQKKRGLEPLPFEF